MPVVDAAAAYGVTEEAQGRCELQSWLVPDACLLPLPFSVVVELGQWERQSEELRASPESQKAFEGKPSGWLGGVDAGGVVERVSPESQQAFKKAGLFGRGVAC